MKLWCNWTTTEDHSSPPQQPFTMTLCGNWADFLKIKCIIFLAFHLFLLKFLFLLKHNSIYAGGHYIRNLIGLSFFCKSLIKIHSKLLLYCHSALLIQSFCLKMTNFHWIQPFLALSKFSSSHLSIIVPQKLSWPKESGAVKLWFWTDCSLSWPITVQHNIETLTRNLFCSVWSNNSLMFSGGSMDCLARSHNHIKCYALFFWSQLCLPSYDGICELWWWLDIFLSEAR